MRVNLLVLLTPLSGDKIFDGGMKIGPNLGRVSIKFEQNIHQDLSFNFSSHKPDHHILNIAYQLAKENPTRQVILVSKDVNLRMKAKSIGLMAQDYKTDHVKDIAGLYTGHRIIEDIPEDLISKMYTSPFEIDVSEVEQERPFIPASFIYAQK